MVFLYFSTFGIGRHNRSDQDSYNKVQICINKFIINEAGINNTLSPL